MTRHGGGYGDILSSKLTPVDPRTSSSQSLHSAVSDSDGRRTLLIVYIHGFYGNDQSFQSFPYHVHSYLKSALADSHVIHSKIYPRYKTYRAIEVARDNFSDWLRPHEGPLTDTILVGHSMGGILAADVVLMPNRNNPYNYGPHKHNILGTVSLDCPFLGLHPGIIVSGISSLFQPSDDPLQQSGGINDTLSAPGSDAQSTISVNTQTSASSFSPPPTSSVPRTPTDPFYNPPFFNDNPFKEAPFVKRFVNFVNKHKAEGLVNATAKHVLSHLEYGGCLADYPGLTRRYNKLRALEDVDELQAISEGKFDSRSQPRVRFVNYYTLCSGRKKAPKTPPALEPSSSTDLTTASPPSVDDDADAVPEPRTSLGQDESSAGNSRVSISIPEPSDLGSEGETPFIARTVSPMSTGTPPADTKDDARSGSATPEMSHLSMQDVEPIPMSEFDGAEEHHARRDSTTTTTTTTTTASSLSALPPIPDEPTKPVTPDLSQYTDKDARKQAERESRRLRKAYEQAVKDRERAIRERQKMVDKQRRKASKEASKEVERQGKEALEERQRQEKAAAAAAADAALLQQQEPRDGQPESATAQADEPPREAKEKEKKNKKFCTLPRKTNGVMDPAWVDVYLDGVDEVGAHCGLFFPGAHYERLIGDVGGRIVDWVHDDMTKRAILELQ